MFAPIVNRLNAVLLKSLAYPDIQEKFLKYGLTIAPSSAAELAAIQADEVKRWEGPVKASGFKED